MSWKSFGRIIPWISIAAFALASLPVLAATGPETPSAAVGQPNAACAHSNSSMTYLAVIDNSGKSGFQCLGLTLSGEVIRAFRTETHSFVSGRGSVDVELVKIAEFSTAVLESNHGAVLDGVPGHDAIILQGHLPTPPDNAKLVISYLYNGFTGDFRSCEIRLEWAPGSGWRLIDRFHRTISHIVIRIRTIPLIGMFGIADLEGACS
jgi:hypothetical protein